MSNDWIGELCEEPDGLDDTCPVCGGKLTISTIYGKYTEMVCENGECEYAWDDAPPEKHYG
jgi:hypothetical protein